MLFASVLAIGIFVFDTISPLQVAVAVLYVVVVLIAASGFGRQGVLIAAVACVALTGGSYLLAHGLAFKGTAPMRSVMSLAAIGITTLLALRNLSVNERLREMERERTNLARFFSPKLVEQLVQIDVPLSVARYQPAAVLFVDMLDFTAYSSVMKPDEVIAMLRDLLALLSDCVFSRNGMIDKFLGDGLMAAFGLPMPSPMDATNAVGCALDMLRSVDEWNGRCRRFGDAAIRIAIGIHYGDVVLGDIGSDRKLELTVLGDTVNIANRVEAYCRSLDTTMLVTGALVDALRAESSDEIVSNLTDLGRHALRGRFEPIQLYGTGWVSG